MNRFLLMAAAMAAAVLLAACYESKTLLLDASAARQPATSYDEWSYTSEDTTYRARLNPRSDGWYDYGRTVIQKDGSEGDWDQYAVLLNFLENFAETAVYVFGYWNDDEQAYVYGLVILEPDGAWRTILPACDYFIADDEKTLAIDVDAAKAAGAEFRLGDIEDVCVFSTADSLFAAMRSIVRHPDFPLRFEAAYD